MSYSTIVQWFRQSASAHYQIAHDVGARNSFFRLNENRERIAAANGRIDYPQLCLESIGGSYTSAGAVLDNAVVGFEIRAKVDDLTDYDEIDTKKELCKQIGEQFLQLIEQESEVGSYCYVFGGFHLSSVQWEFFGPDSHNEYGCRFRLPFRAVAYNPYTVDLSGVFLARRVSLLDFDGAELFDFDNQPLTEPI